MKRFLYCTILCLLISGASIPSLTFADDADGTKELGSRAAEKLLMNLQAHLMKAIADKGVVGALSFCSEKAMPLSQEVGAALKGDISVKRTSDRLRNQDNAPDALEKEALAFFEKNPDAPFFLQEEESNGTRRYYEPLKVKAACLQCHGDPKNFSEELQVTLKQLYPEDAALGYKEGDLRGVVRVEIEG